MFPATQALLSAARKAGAATNPARGTSRIKEFNSFCIQAPLDGAPTFIIHAHRKIIVSNPPRSQPPRQGFNNRLPKRRGPSEGAVYQTAPAIGPFKISRPGTEARFVYC